MTTTITRGYMPPPLPDKDGPSCEWPRKYSEFSLPLSTYHMGSIYLPQHITTAEWRVAMDYLEVCRQVLVDEA